MAGPVHDRTPIWTTAFPLAAALLVGLKLAGVVPGDITAVLILAGLLLGATVFAAVHHAEVLALKLGEPFGSILLAVAVTVIEVALIVSVLISGAPGADELPRDTVFAAVMIVLNGVVGLCLVLGGRRHWQQVFQVEGAYATLSVLGTLATFALVMPNFTLSTRGPNYAPIQLIVVGAMSLVLYLVFVFVQTVRHRDYFLDPVPGLPPDHPAGKPSSGMTAASAVLLPVSLAAVVLLAKILSQPLEVAVRWAGFPTAFVGVVIAAVVLLPEGMAAVKAALANKLQGAINLALGSAVASIGLTIPTVALVSLLTDRTLALGLSEGNLVLLFLTLFVSTLTFGTGRTTVLQGAVHLVIFVVFLVLSAVP